MTQPFDPQTFEPTQEGLFDIGWDDYRKLKALNSSSLESLGQSPLHLRTQLDTPGKPSTEAQKAGTAFHYAILEPERFKKEIVRDLTGISRNKKVYKEWKGDQERAGLTIIKAEQYDGVLQMTENVKAKAVPEEFLRRGLAETTILWKDPDFGFWCKARIDWIPGAVENSLLDVKTTENASEEVFDRSAWRFKYYRQAAWYLMGMTQAANMIYNRFFWMAWEKVPPYDGNIIEADRYAVENQTEMLYSMRSLYARCLEKDEWPGYPDRVIQRGSVYEYPDLWSESEEETEDDDDVII